MRSTHTPPKLIRTDPRRAPTVVIADANLVIDISKWIDKSDRNAPARISAAFEVLKIPGFRDRLPIVSIWSALGEMAWSNLPNNGMDRPDLDEVLRKRGTEARLIQEVFSRLYDASDRDRWLEGEPPGWVRALKRSITEPLPQHDWSLQAGNQAWLVRSATGLLAFSALEPVNKGADEAFRVKVFARYLNEAVRRSGGLGPMEETYVLMRLFEPSPQRRSVDRIDPLSVIKVKEPCKDPGVIMEEALNTVRDFAMLRFAHDAMAGCGSFTEIGPRPSALLTSDKALQLLAEWLPPPVADRDGVIGYNAMHTLNRLSVREETRESLKDVLLSAEAGAEGRISSRGSDFDDLELAYVGLRSLAADLAASS